MFAEQKLKQLVAAVKEYLPAAQSVQVLATVAAVVVEYLPAAQLVQVAVETLFTASLKVPCGHPAQTLLNSQKPARQRQEVASDSVADIELAGHGVHAVAPMAAEYVPAPQLMQVLPTVAPTVVEYVPAPQLMQVLPTVAPTVVEYLPATQLAQLVLV